MDKDHLAELARQKCFILYEGQKTPHRSCGIALAETFNVPTAPYQSLRRGGSWKKITENLDFISGLKHRHGFTLKLHMVVQRQNWHEMLDMCELGSRIGADQVVLNKIEDWQTYGDFDGQRVPDTQELHHLLEQVDAHPLSVTWTEL